MKLLDQYLTTLYRDPAPGFRLDRAHLAAFPTGHYAAGCFGWCIEMMAVEALEAMGEANATR